MAPRDRLSVFSSYRPKFGWTPFVLRCLRAQSAMPCIGRWAASHPVEHDVSLSDAAEYLALYSLWYGLGGV